MASLAELAAQSPYQWYQTEGGSQAFGIPGQQPIFEYLPATNEVYSYRGQVPQEILAQFPGARARDVTTDPAFEYGRTDDFAGKLGDYMIPAVAALVGGGMIAPWAAAGGAGAGAGLAPGTAGYGGVMDPAVGALEGAGATGGAAGGQTGGNIAGMGLADPWGAGSVSGTGALAEAPTALSGMAGGVVDAVTPAAGGWGSNLASSAAGLVPAASGDGSLAKWIAEKTGLPKSAIDAAGRLIPGALGAYASNQQANSLADLAAKYEGYGAPSRARYEGSFAPGFTMAQDPGYQDALDQAAKATLHGMSAKFGNPAGSPNAWAQTLQDLYKGTAYPALQQFRNQNAATSGIAAFNSAAPQAQTGQLQAQSNIYNAIGAGIGNVFSPAPTLADIARQFQALKG